MQGIGVNSLSTPARVYNTNSQTKAWSSDSPINGEQAQQITLVLVNLNLGQPSSCALYYSSSVLSLGGT